MRLAPRIISKIYNAEKTDAGRTGERRSPGWHLQRRHCCL
jgi:hypothetical protein